MLNSTLLSIVMVSFAVTLQSGPTLVDACPKDTPSGGCSKKVEPVATATEVAPTTPDLPYSPDLPTTDCYTCSSCSMPFDPEEAEVAEKCGYCVTAILSYKGVVNRIDRMCKKNCPSSGPAGDPDVSMELKCCQTSKCNDEDSASSKLVQASSLITSLLLCLSAILYFNSYSGGV